MMQYDLVRAWYSLVQDPSPWTVDQMVARAAAENAPEDAYQRTKDGVWKTLNAGSALAGLARQAVHKRRRLMNEAKPQGELF